ncbi:hypothetical protein DPQ33_00175 [Oceanidesulfovibrio indonesiensis]|uniref:Response regulatory domain-containing protein n=1 Tax=Oceanidesulfovibrio indonesiensis TaxID=54767 RepID=A0A7M3MJS9_9BACT|nr:response regulator [Oceanidesulfovibrio indonesiensis]TVM19691.1 hypothetical protein DPQ33_00175 [Oceanidesulfovibrio indonesiensis]
MEHARTAPALGREQSGVAPSRNSKARWSASCANDLPACDLAEMRILVLSTSHHHARTDRKLLLRLGAADVRHESSGVRAARQLVTGKADCVILDGRLDDMSGLEFVRLIRLHPRTALMPVVLASVENGRAAVLEALASGISGYLIRPYSMVGLARQIGRVLEQPARTIEEGMGVSREAFEEKMAEYEAPSAIEAPPEDRVAALLAEVDELLRVNALDAACEAVVPLARTSDPAVRAEAHVRLAEVHLRRANPGMRLDALAEAGSSFQDAGEFERAAECFAMLQALNPSAPGPDEQAARTALKRRDHAEAARIYSRMLNVREPEAVCRSISRACMFTSDPVTNARLLCTELGNLRGAEEAQAIYERVVGPPPKPAEEPVEREDRARGRLAEVLAVARYTVRAYRAMKHQPGEPAILQPGA